MIGLVTVLYNSNDVLEGFLKSIALQTFKDYHLYIIDNTPSDATDNLLNDLLNRFPITSFTHVKNHSNIGVAAGNNQGINLALQANTSHTLLLNNDIEFDDIELLKTLYNHAVQQKEDILIPKILYYDTRKIWMAGGKLLKWIGGNKHIGTGDDQSEHNTPQYFDYAPTCFMLINNEVFKKAGVMDEQYFVYYDDLDFIWRTNKQGFRIYYLPALIVLHKVSSSTGGQESLFATYYVSRNMFYFIRKNYNGLLYFAAMLYSFTSRGIKILISRKDKRQRIVQGIKDGWNIKVLN